MQHVFSIAVVFWQDKGALAEQATTVAETWLAVAATSAVIVEVDLKCFMAVDSDPKVIPEELNGW